MYIHKTFPAHTFNTLPSRILQFNEAGGDTVAGIEKAVSILTDRTLPFLKMHSGFPVDVKADQITLRVDEPNVRVVWHGEEGVFYEEHFRPEQFGFTPADLQILQIAQELEGNQSLADDPDGEKVAPEVAAARAAARLEIVLSMLSAEGRARLAELLPSSWFDELRGQKESRGE